MSYIHTEEWRMRIVLSVAWQEIQPVEKITEEGEQFSCFAYHLDGEGLIQIVSTSPKTGTTRTYRFNKYGGLRGVFDTHANGADELIYDCFSGQRKRHEIEVDCSAMIGRLELVLHHDEEMAYDL